MTAITAQTTAFAARLPRLRPAVLGVPLLLGVLAADHGGYFPTSWGWSALVLAWGAVMALLLGKEISLSRAELALLAAATAFLVWLGLSIVWSSARVESVDELERALVYLTGLAALVLLVRRRSVAQLLAGTTIAIGLVCAYALATRLFPDRVGQFDSIAGYRLSEPVGYWNALGVLAALAALLLATGFAARAGKLRSRAAAAAALPLLALTIEFTFSRGELDRARGRACDGDRARPATPAARRLPPRARAARRPGRLARLAVGGADDHEQLARRGRLRGPPARRRPGRPRGRERRHRRRSRARRTSLRARPPVPADRGGMRRGDRARRRGRCRRRLRRSRWDRAPGGPLVRVAPGARRSAERARVQPLERRPPGSLARRVASVRVGAAAGRRRRELRAVVAAAPADLARSPGCAQPLPRDPRRAGRRRSAAARADAGAAARRGSEPPRPARAGSARRLRGLSRPRRHRLGLGDAGGDPDRPRVRLPRR